MQSRCPSNLGDDMNTYKIEIILELNEEQSLEWVFQAIKDQLEDGEFIKLGRFIKLEPDIEPESV
jgi:hypothetical protein